MCARAQPCPTLCDPLDCSLPGSSVRRIFQARTLEWVAISFSNRYTYPLPFGLSPPSAHHSALSRVPCATCFPWCFLNFRPMSPSSYLYTSLFTSRYIISPHHTPLVIEKITKILFTVLFAACREHVLPLPGYYSIFEEIFKFNEG